MTIVSLQCAMVAVLSLTSSVVTSIQPQETITIRGGAACRQCAAHLSRVTTLRTDTIPLTNEPRQVVKLGGKYFVLDLINRDRVYMFDSAGIPRAVLGGSGAGPGEFRSVRAIAVHADTAFFYDEANLREIAVTADGRIVGERPAELGRLENVIRTPEATIINAAIFTPDRIGLPLHALGPDARVMDSFRSASARYLPERPWELLRVLAERRGGGIWASPRAAYRLESWSATGQPLLFVERQVSWFEPYAPRPIGKPDRPPPWIMGIQDAGGGRLVILISVPVENYTQVLGPRKRTPRGYLYDVGRREQLFDTLVEVLNVQSQTVEVSATLNEYVMGFIGDNSVYGYRIRPDGSPEVYIATLHIDLPAMEVRR